MNPGAKQGTEKEEPLKRKSTSLEKAEGRKSEQDQIEQEVCTRAGVTGGGGGGAAFGAGGACELGGKAGELGCGAGELGGGAGELGGGAGKLGGEANSAGEGGAGASEGDGEGEITGGGEMTIGRACAPLLEKKENEQIGKSEQPMMEKFESPAKKPRASPIKKLSNLSEDYPPRGLPDDEEQHQKIAGLQLPLVSLIQRT